MAILHHRLPHLLALLVPAQLAKTRDISLSKTKVLKVTNPFVDMRVASGNPDAMVIVCWIQAEVQNGRLLAAEKGTFL